MSTMKQITKLALFLALLALIASTVHAQSAPCNPYTDAACGGCGAGPIVNPYNPGRGGPIGGPGPYQAPGSSGDVYDLAVPTGVSMAWTVNGDMHLDNAANALGWVVLKNLDIYDQTVTVMFTFEDHEPVFKTVPLPAASRVTISLHDTNEFQVLQHRFFAATAFFQRAGHMYATFARACAVSNGVAECVDSHDVGSVEVRMK